MQNTVYLVVAFLSALALAAASSTCPSGELPVNCLVAPCSVSKCPGDPKATCVDNYCGGCNAIWYSASGGLADCTVKSKCPSDQPQVQCFVNPCRGATCTNHPRAKCVANYCGGCNAEWYNPNGELVQCDASS